MLGDFIKRTGKAPIAVFDSGVGEIGRASCRERV